MAMSFTCCKRIAHFRYLLHKATAKPILDHGVTTIPKPLHVTRTGVRTLYIGGPVGGKYQRLLYGNEEWEIQELLEDPDLSSNSTTAVDISEKLLKLQNERGLAHLHTDILRRRDIKSIWKIAGAGYNNGRAAAILPTEPCSPEKWVGMSWKVKRGLPWFQSICGLERIPRFPLEGHSLEMLICRGRGINVSLRAVIFPEKSGLLRVEMNPADHPEGEECDLALKFGDAKQLLRHFPLDLIKLDNAYQAEWNKALHVIAVEDPWPLNDQFVVYIRYIGPNLLVGQSWKVDNESKILCGEILLIKEHATKK